MKGISVLGKGATVGPYTIVNAVLGGIGGMATVYEARLGHETVALKVAHPGLSDFAKEEVSFLGALNLHHPHIVRILPTPLSDGSEEFSLKDPRTGQWYFAMEFLWGGDLGHWLSQRKRLSLPEAITIVEQIGSALDAAHQAGILHLDVKPSNILFRQDPRKGQIQAVLTDFGIARPKGRSVSGQSLTVEYASPEQARQVQGEAMNVGGTSDLYSLAVILYEMLTGRLPFDAQNDTAMLHHIVYEQPVTTLPPLPPELSPILQKALAKDPQARYPTAQALVADLKRLPSTAYESDRASAPRQVSQRRQFSPFMALAAGIVVGLGLGAPFGYYFGARDVIPSGSEVARVEATTRVPTATVGVVEDTPVATVEQRIDKLPTAVPEDAATEAAATPTDKAPTRVPTSTPKPTPTPTATYRPRPTSSTPQTTPSN